MGSGVNRRRTVALGPAANLTVDSGLYKGALAWQAGWWQSGHDSTLSAATPAFHWLPRAGSNWWTISSRQRRWAKRDQSGRAAHVTATLVARTGRRKTASAHAACKPAASVVVTVLRESKQQAQRPAVRLTLLLCARSQPLGPRHGALPTHA